jgi:branched-chain amino acid transport system substrate-binding protein
VCSKEGHIMHPHTKIRCAQQNKPHILYYLTLILIISCAYSNSWAQKVKTPSESYKVAVLLDLQGRQSSLGVPAMNGFLLAMQRLSTNDSKMIFLSLNNTKSNLQLTKDVAHKIAGDVSIATGFTDNDSVKASAGIFNKNHIPFLSIGATSPELPLHFENVYLVPFGDNAQAAAAANFAFKKFGPNVAILWDFTSDYSTMLPRYFNSAFLQLGGQVVYNKSYGKTCEIGYFAKAIRALDNKPDFIYLAGLPTCIGKTIESLRKAGVRLPIIGGDGLDSPNLTQKNSLSNVFFTTHAWLSTNNDSPITKQFLALYKNTYGRLPEDSFAALGFDAANLIIEAINRTKSTSSSAIFKALDTIKHFHGVTGDISYSNKNHIPTKTVWILMVSKGKRQLAAHFTPKNTPKVISLNFGVKQ